MLLGVPVVLFNLNFTSWLSKLTALLPRLCVNNTRPTFLNTVKLPRNHSETSKDWTGPPHTPGLNGTVGSGLPLPGDWWSMMRWAWPYLHQSREGSNQSNQSNQCNQSSQSNQIKSKQSKQSNQIESIKAIKAIKAKQSNQSNQSNQ